MSDYEGPAGRTVGGLRIQVIGDDPADCVTDEGLHACPYCEVAFGSRRALMVHQVNIHRNAGNQSCC